MIKTNSNLQICSDVILEVTRAESKHPNWPVDVIYQAAIVQEECGELMRAAVQCNIDKTGTLAALRTEAIHTAAMCFRLLKQLPTE